MKQEYSTLSVEQPQPETILVRLNRPDSLNALNPTMVDEIHEVFDALSSDATCRVVILTGAGRAFCAGLDIKTTLADQSNVGAEGMASKLKAQQYFAGMVTQIRALRQPVIAAVNGVAVGAGLGFCLAADVRIAAASARFLVGAVRIGLSACECGISYHLPRLIGASRAFEIMLTGRPVEASEAERIGLVSQVVPEDKLLDAALELARSISSNSPFAVENTKQVMWANLDAPGFAAAVELENRTQVIATRTEDFREVMVAFTEKRPPVFKGE